jgi:hypothetical protein
VPVKQCSRCKEALPIDSFYASTRSKDGLQAYCKECQLYARRKRVASKRLTLLAALPADHYERKRCPKCSEVKPRAEYHKNGSAPDGLQGYCKECSAEMQRAYVARNAEALALKKAERLSRPVDLVGEKQCTKCGEVKAYGQFYRHGTTADGRATYCIECQKADTRARRAANRDQVKAWNAAARDRADKNVKASENRRNHLRRQYGITPEDYDEMLAAQGGVCAICGQTEWFIDPRKGTPRCLSVDHCHATGKVRGLLCGRCNRSIGHFEDNPEIIARAAAYLPNLALVFDLIARTGLPSPFKNVGDAAERAGQQTSKFGIAMSGALKMAGAALLGAGPGGGLQEPVRGCGRVSEDRGADDAGHQVDRRRGEGVSPKQVGDLASAPSRRRPASTTRPFSPAPTCC